jgi:hypothetical protein
MPRFVRTDGSAPARSRMVPISAARTDHSPLEGEIDRVTISSMPECRELAAQAAAVP